MFSFFRNGGKSNQTNNEVDGNGIGSSGDINGYNLQDEGNINNMNYAGYSQDRERLLLENTQMDGEEGRRIRRREKRKRNMLIMRRIGKVFAALMIIVFIVVVPYGTIHAIAIDKARPDFVAFYSAGAFVLLTVVMSSRQIYTHLTNWYMPDVQKYVVRIIWMVPLYGFQSWLSLGFMEQRLYIDALRDLYEAYVIQSFLYYLVELLGGDDALVLILQNKDPHYGDHGSFLGKILKSWEMGLEFMLQCKHGVLQYVGFKILATVATLLLQPLGLYGQGEILNWTKGYMYISAVINLSQMYALYCLVKFYHATRDNLIVPVNWKPLGKFLCIKGVVFFTWWQGIAISLLQSYGMLTKFWHWNAEDISNVLQDYLVCIEMFLFAIAHSFTFTYKEYLPNNRSVGINQVGSNNYDSKPNTKSGGNIHTNDTMISPLDPTNPHIAMSKPKYDDEDDDDYRPPTIKTLHAPMGFRDALWSTALPNETLNDLKLLRNGVSDQLMNRSADVGMISMASMQHAESI